MSLVALPSPRIYPDWWGAAFSAAPSFGSSGTLNAAGHYTAYVIEALEDMVVISHVGFRCVTVAGSPTADVRIETVDAATGLPSGTLWAVNSNIVTGTLVSNAYVLHALTASATILKGQKFCVKIAYASGTSIQVARLTGFDTQLGLPYTITNTGTPTKAALQPAAVLALGSSTTAFYTLPGFVPASAVTGSAFNNTSAAKRGVRFKFPFPCEVSGIWYRNSTLANFNTIIMDDAGNELSGSSTAFDGDVIVGGPQRLMSDNLVTVPADTWTRAVVEPTTASNIAIFFFTMPSADYRSAMPGGVDFHYTTFAGSWDDTLLDQVPLMSLLVSKLDNGAGAGGGLLAHPGMGGGFI